MTHSPVGSIQYLTSQLHRARRACLEAQMILVGSRDRDPERQARVLAQLEAVLDSPSYAEVRAAEVAP